jgi:hypothetical protein
MSGIQTVTMPNPPKVIHTCIYGYGVKGLSVVRGAVPCQQHWHQVHANWGVADSCEVEVLCWAMASPCFDVQEPL